MKKAIAEESQVTIDFLQEVTGIHGIGSMFALSVPAGARIPVTYYHEHFDETVYGMERIITFTVEAKAIDIEPGENRFVPCDAVYGFDSLKKIDDAKTLLS